MSAGERPGDASEAGRQQRPLRPDMTVRHVAAVYPGCREILRRYSESEDRPGKFGHLEPLECFARRCGVAIGPLLQELATAAGVGVDREAAAVQVVHRPFVTAALAITLSLGAAWGAWLLGEIGAGRSFAVVPAASIVAHGETQLWGFLALFVIGIALRYLPMIASGPRLRPVLARLLLGVLLLGVIGSFSWSLWSPRWLGLGVASGVALVLGAAGFRVLVLRRLAGKLRETWARLIVAAAVWMMLWAGATLVLRLGVVASGAETYSESARQLLMELAIFGFALNAIFGFGQKLLSGLLGTGSPHRGALEATFWLHNLGVIGLVLASAQGITWAAGVGAAALVAGAVAYALGLRGFRRRRRLSTRPEQGEAFLDHYIQLAFFWLVAGLVLLLGGTLFWTARGAEAPHAYLGATRHALTVGFITTLILGVGQRLLPILGHTRLAWPRLVVPVFVLIASGNLLRVATELATLTDDPLTFAIMPVSALLELAALGLFSANALRTLWPARDPLLQSGQATVRTPVALLLAEHPWLEDHLTAWGWGYLDRVWSVPAELTVGTLAASEGRDPQEAIARINALLRETPSPAESRQE